MTSKPTRFACEPEDRVTNVLGRSIFRIRTTDGARYMTQDIFLASLARELFKANATVTMEYWGSGPFYRDLVGIDKVSDDHAV